MGKLEFEEETFQIRGAAFEVYREMGSGFLESVYQECMEKELRRRVIPFESQCALALSYKGEPLDHNYVPDLICYCSVIVELKAVKEMVPEHQAQLMNYLKASGLKVGLLINFGSYPGVQIERLIK